MHGFHSSRAALCDLCHFCDVILVQEYWLAPDCLNLLSSINDNFVSFACSAMSTKLASGVFRGRPFVNTC